MDGHTDSQNMQLVSVPETLFTRHKNSNLFHGNLDPLPFTPPAWHIIPLYFWPSYNLHPHWHSLTLHVDITLCCVFFFFFGGGGAFYLSPKFSALKPQDSFGEFDSFFFLIFRKCRKSSENTIRPSCNCFEWHIVMQYCTVANYQYVHNLWQSVRGTPIFFFSWK